MKQFPIDHNRVSKLLSVESHVERALITRKALVPLFASRLRKAQVTKLEGKTVSWVMPHTEEELEAAAEAEADSLLASGEDPDVVLARVLSEAE